VSDEKDKNVEQLAQENAAAEESAVETGANVKEELLPPKSAPVPRAAAVPPARRGSSAVAWLALLLVLALAAGAAWLLRELQAREQTLAERVGGLEDRAGREQGDLEQLGARLQQAWQQGVAPLEQQLAAAREQSAQLAQSVRDLESQLAQQRSELERFSATDRRDWLLAEVEYLLRLANQRLLLAGDAGAAQALMTSADNILAGMDEPGLHGLRAAVAADLAAVRAVPRVDVEGVYLRLAALQEQADGLVIFRLREREAGPRPEPAADWRGRLRQGWEQALARLSSYVTIRRRDVPAEALMDPQWEGLVRQNLRMLLEQAQVALLSGNQALYERSLRAAQYWVQQFMDSDEAASRAMSAELEQLEGLTVAVKLPDLSRSLSALQAAIEAQPQPAGDA